MRPGSDLVLVGDVHLDRGDPDLPAFLEYLKSLAPRAGRVVLIGDLFNLWVGDPDLEQEHHRAVTACLRDLRGGGTETHYLEGNRDYRIGAAHEGGAFDVVSSEGIREDWGGLRLWASHGDLVNVRDRQYRTWRRLSRSAAAWRLFSMVPRGRRFAIAESIERRMRASNLDMKRRFPDDAIRRYAAEHIGAEGGAIVLGHFHTERTLELASGRVYVLPEWKGSRRHLRVTSAGVATFEAI